jgi:hypothetical protein
MEKMLKPDASEELQLRYNMDPAKWEKSQRKTFPFNLSLSSIMTISVLLPVVTYLMPFGIEKPAEWKLLAITIAISFLAYHVSNHLIMNFKDVLCAKGKFGRDLNKLGD